MQRALDDVAHHLSVGQMRTAVGTQIRGGEEAGQRDVAGRGMREQDAAGRALIKVSERGDGAAPREDDLGRAVAALQPDRMLSGADCRLGLIP